VSASAIADETGHANDHGHAMEGNRHLVTQPNWRITFTQIRVARFRDRLSVFQGGLYEGTKSYRMMTMRSVELEGLSPSI